MPLGRVGGWTVTWIVELGTLAGAADERRGGRRRLRDAVGPGAAARGDDLVVADGRRLRSAFCTKESIDVAGIGSRSVRPGCPARRGARSVRRWRAGG